MQHEYDEVYSDIFSYEQLVKKICHFVTNFSPSIADASGKPHLKSSTGRRKFCLSCTNYILLSTVTIFF